MTRKRLQWVLLSVGMVGVVVLLQWLTRGLPAWVGRGAIDALILAFLCLLTVRLVGRITESEEVKARRSAGVRLFLLILLLVLMGTLLSWLTENVLPAWLNAILANILVLVCIVGLTIRFLKHHTAGQEHEEGRSE